MATVRLIPICFRVIFEIGCCKLRCVRLPFRWINNQPLVEHTEVAKNVTRGRLLPINYLIYSLEQSGFSYVSCYLWLTKNFKN